MFEPKGDEVTDDGRNYMMSIFKICTVPHIDYCQDDQIEEAEMGGTGITREGAG